MTLFRRSFFAWLALTGLLLGACASTGPAPVSVPTLAAEPDIPVVLVPGITGARLRDPATGKLAWGNGARLVTPRDGGYSLALPLADPGVEKKLEPDGVIEEIRLLWVRKPVYGPVANVLERHGYRRGDLRDPRPGDTLFLFAYDWRRDNELAVRRLFEGLENVRRARGVERLTVDLVCQSNGAHICRYLAKYGGAPFEEAAAGRAGLPETLEIRKVILIGTSNGGSLRILREMDRGRRYVPLLGRKIQPETLFTFPSLYQDLPSYLDSYFLGPDGETLDVDLYDAAAWEKYGWSIFGAAARRRAARHPDLFGGPDDWQSFLEKSLARAQLLQRLLASDPDGFDPPRYYLIQNPWDPTPERAVLLQDDGGEWRLLFTGDKELLRHGDLHRRVTTLGDGHASVASQMHLSPREKEAIAAEPLHVEGDHFELILNPKSLRRLLEFLDDDGG